VFLTKGTKLSSSYVLMLVISSYTSMHGKRVARLLHHPASTLMCLQLPFATCRPAPIVAASSKSTGESGCGTCDGSGEDIPST
jgi:hypothetical protein